MKPQEKAKELVKKMQENIPDLMCVKSQYLTATQCAIIAVDELIDAFEELSIQDSGSVFRDFGHGYWKEVKQELNKL